MKYRHTCVHPCMYVCLSCSNKFTICTGTYKQEHKRIFYIHVHVQRYVHVINYIIYSCSCAFVYVNYTSTVIRFIKCILQVTYISFYKTFTVLGSPVFLKNYPKKLCNQYTSTRYLYSIYPTRP